MKSRIIAILNELRPEFDFATDVNYIEEGMLDSLDVINLVVTLDKTFNISIDGIDIVATNFATLDSIIGLLKKYGINELKVL